MNKPETINPKAILKAIHQPNDIKSQINRDVSDSL